MQPINSSMRLTLQISSLVLLAILGLSAGGAIATSQSIGEQQISTTTTSNNQTTKDLASFDGQPQANQTTSAPIRGRSMDHQQAPTSSGLNRASGRSGRMLDLDHLAGDLNKGDKLARDQSLSGNRQSRMLTSAGDQPQPADQKSVEGRAKGGGGGGKRMSIKGFIPIVSLESAKDGKQLESQLDGLTGASSHDHDDETEQEVEHPVGQEQAAKGNGNYLREQVAANFGGQTSIGHASFAGYPTSSSSDGGGGGGGQQYDASSAGQQQWQNQQQQQAGRANRKLLDGGHLLSGLASSKRFVIGSPNLLAQQASQFDVNRQQLQNPPTNVPPIAAYFDQQLVGAGCICVPFFQCKNGYLTESQLSRSQLAQISAASMQMQAGGSSPFSAIQLPRSLANSDGQQQQQQQMQDPTELYQLAGQSAALMQQQQQQQQQQPTQQTLASQPNDQQMVNDIYEQLRKNIESANLEQQAQVAYQLQQQQPQSLIDERSSKSSSSSNSTTPPAEGDERSLFNPLASRRQSSFGAQPKCGIMRTCCRIPPKLLLDARPTPFQQPQHLAVQPTTSSHQLVMQPNHLRRPTNRMNLLASPTRQQQQQPPLDYQHQHQAYQLVAQEAQQFTQQQQQHQQQLQQRPVPAPVAAPSGQFMAGRCGMRQTLGISGRVQNSPPGGQAEGSADFGEFPAHAAILKRLGPGDSLFVCSAVLISSQWLATAAHCVRKHRLAELKVRLGEWDVSRDDEFYPFVELGVRELHLHPEFQPASLANDLALIKLEQPVDGAQLPHVAPACLVGSQAEQQALVGQRCWLAGWGKDAFGQQGAFQSILRKVDLPVVGREECELALRHHTKLGKHFRLHPNNICAGGERGKDACEGDGGAGLYCLDPHSGLSKAVGLVSWGVGCGQVGVPGVYLNLANFYAWIESVVGAGEEAGLSLDGRQQTGADNFRSIISERTINGTTAASSTPAPLGQDFPLESRNAPLTKASNATSH